MGKDNGVSVRIHKKFFDEIFEPTRKELEKQTGGRLGQINFTEILAKKKIKLRIPKIRFNIKKKRLIKKRFKLI